MENHFVAYRVREAGLAEAGIIAAFQKAMAMETEELELDANTLEAGVTAVFSNPRLGQYHVAEYQDEVVASLLITIEWSDWRNRSVWWIQSVYVKPSFRGKGCFRAMYEHVKALVKIDPSIGGLRLYVDKRNKPAISTYKRLGMDDSHYSLFEWMKE